MPRKKVAQEKVAPFIRNRKATTFYEIEKHFQCTHMTIYRKLRNVPYLTSYNQNGTGVTLGDIPVFDEFGIWEYEKFLFSKWGTLRDTINKLIDLSPAGLHAKNLNKILRIRSNNHLSICVKNELIIRNNEFGQPIYFSKVPEIRKQQYNQRTELYFRQIPSKRILVSKESIIRILAAALKHHETSPGKIVLLLKQEGIDLNEQTVEWVFRKYNIQKKPFQ